LLYYGLTEQAGHSGHAEGGEGGGGGEGAGEAKYYNMAFSGALELPAYI